MTSLSAMRHAGQAAWLALAMLAASLLESLCSRQYVRVRMWACLYSMVRDCSTAGSRKLVYRSTMLCSGRSAPFPQACCLPASLT